MFLFFQNFVLKILSHFIQLFQDIWLIPQLFDNLILELLAIAAGNKDANEATEPNSKLDSSVFVFFLVFFDMLFDFLSDGPHVFFHFFVSLLVVAYDKVCKERHSEWNK